MIDSGTFDVAANGAGAAVPLLTGGDLMLLGRELPAVFDILVTTATGSIQLRCHALLRITPQRRIVARANFAGACVIAKFFIGARASVDREWEERGHAAFVRSGVATPQIIDRGSLMGVGVALLFECVDATHPATEADLMSMMPIVAQLHTHGVVQNNLHLGNVLRSAQRVAADRRQRGQRDGRRCAVAAAGERAQSGAAPVAIRRARRGKVRDRVARVCGGAWLHDDRCGRRRIDCGGAPRTACPACAHNCAPCCVTTRILSCGGASGGVWSANAACFAARSRR